MIFTARQIQEKYREQQQDLYMIFIDLTKAFDTVHREGLWKVLRKIGCTEKFIRVIRNFHEGMMAQVLDSGEISDPFCAPTGLNRVVFWPRCFSASIFQ